MSALIYVLNGPSLNLPGLGEPEFYDGQTLEGLSGPLRRQAEQLGVKLDLRQSNHEGHLIDWLHEAHAVGAKAVILNPGGYSHTSVALHDAINAIKTPVILVHLRDPKTRERFRQIDFVALAASKSIIGKGTGGYALALGLAAAI